jgi:hypothetical protein
MSITQKLLSAAVLVVLIGISACNDDEGPSQLSKEDAQSRISEFNSTASGDLQGFADADGVQAIKDFFDLAQTDDPFGSSSLMSLTSSLFSSPQKDRKLIMRALS